MALRRLSLGTELFILSLGLTLPVTACSKEKKAAGALVLAVSSDMSMPTGTTDADSDFDEIGVDVLSFGAEYHSNEYDVGSSGLKLPATLTIVAGKDSDQVEIRLYSLKDSSVRTMREVVTSVPKDRTALLPITIEWLCDGSGGRNADRDVIAVGCDAGQTCSAGRCVSTDIDSAGLQTYEPGLVFGGGNGPGNSGRCFDTVACFADGQGIELDPETCTAEAPPADDLNVAIVLPPGGDGICGDESCLVPLDRSASRGFDVKDGRLTLPQAVCTRIAEGKALGVATSNACETKTESVPTCGPWSSVTSERGTFRGPGPDLGDAGALPQMPEAGAGDAGDAS